MRTKKLLGYAAISLLSSAAVIFLAFSLSPWPSVILIRSAFDKGGKQANANLEKFVPSGLVVHRDISYYPLDTTLKLDLYHPEPSAKMPARYPLVLWIHGGGLVSGSRQQVANYCRILSAKGYAVAAIDYTLAPEARYPTPIIQVQNSLDFLLGNTGRFSIDSANIFLAGDSGGAMIAASSAAVITDPSYAALTRVRPARLSASQLKGQLLFCGIYSTDNLKTKGQFGSFMKTVLWSYFGKKDISADPYAKTAAVLNYIDAGFPPAFLSAGNADPLLPQSIALAGKMQRLGIPVKTLFFPGGLAPELGHEYQFDLSSPHARRALEQATSFLSSRTSR